MTNKSITLNFSNRSSLTEGLILEQADWVGNTGVVTKLDLVKAIATALYGDPENDIDCGISGDGSYLSGLYVYLYNQNTSYDIGITHGELGEVIVQEVEVRELITFSLGDESSSKYPIQELITAEWAADTWGVDGGVVTPPSISVSGNTVSLSNSVYGTVIIVYRTIRHARSLSVPPREESVENVFDSYAWARWNGGVKMLKLNPPDNADESYLNQTNCIWGSRWGDHIPPDDPGDPYGDGYGGDFDVDYCTQQVITYYV